MRPSRTHSVGFATEPIIGYQHLLVKPSWRQSFPPTSSLCLLMSPLPTFFSWYSFFLISVCLPTLLCANIVRLNRRQLLLPWCQPHPPWCCIRWGHVASIRTSPTSTNPLRRLLADCFCDRPCVVHTNSRCVLGSSGWIRTNSKRMNKGESTNTNN